MPNKEDYKELLDQNLSQEDKAQLEQANKEIKAENVSKDQSPSDLNHTYTPNVEDSARPIAGVEDQGTKESTQQYETRKDNMVKESGQTLENAGVEARQEQSTNNLPGMAEAQQQTGDKQMEQPENTQEAPTAEQGEQTNNNLPGIEDAQKQGKGESEGKEVTAEKESQQEQSQPDRDDDR